MCERLFLTPTIHMSDKKYFQKFLINTIIKSLITFSIFHNNGKRKSSLWSHGKIDTLLISLKYRAIRGPKLFLYIRVFVRVCTQCAGRVWKAISQRVCGECACRKIPSVRCAKICPNKKLKIQIYLKPKPLNVSYDVIFKVYDQFRCDLTPHMYIL